MEYAILIAMKRPPNRLTRAAWLAMERPPGGITVTANNCHATHGAVMIGHNTGTFYVQQNTQQNVVINMSLQIAVEQLLKIVQDPDDPSNAKATWIEFAQNQLNKVP